MKRPAFRRLAAIGVGLALVVSTAACSSSGSSGSSGETKLVVYSADPANAATYQKVLNDFGASNNASISLISYPSATFIQQFTPAVDSHAQIDALLANGQDIRYLQGHGLVGDLGSAVNKTDLIPAAYEPFTINNKLYAVGIGGVNVTAFVYNDAIFQKYGLTVPKTDSDLIADAAKLKGTDIAPVSVPGGNVYLWPIWMMQMLQQTTHDTSTATTTSTLTTGSPSFDSSQYVDGFKEMAKLGTGGIFENGWQGVQEPAAVDLFAQGKAAMFFGGSWDISTISQQAPQMSIKAFPFPNFVPGVTSTAFGGAGVAAATYGKVDANHKSLVDKLVAYMATAAVDKQLLTGTAAISLPANKSVTSDSQSALQTQLVKDFLPTESTFLDWYWPKQVTAAFQDQMVGVVAGTTSPENAAKAAQSAFQQAKAAGYTYN